MGADYLRAAIPDPVVILGHQLLPFSLGHNLILSRFGNSFVTGGAWSLEDLLFGVFVCSRKYDDALDEISHGIRLPNGLFRRLRNLPERRIEYADFVRLWREAIGAFDIQEKCRAFQNYVQDGSSRPDLHAPEQSARAHGDDIIHRVDMVLRIKLGFTRDESLNCPWGQALWHYFGFWELEDRCKIINNEEREQIELHKRMLAELEQEGNDGRQG